MSRRRGRGRGRGRRRGRGSSRGQQNDDELCVKLQADLDRANQQIQTFERFLVLRSEQAARARREQEMMRERLEQLDRDFEKERTDRFTIATDMIRQYKATEASLIARIDAVTREKTELADLLELSRIEKTKQKEHFEQLLDQKDKIIRQQKKKMNDMIGQFQDVLRDVLSKMGQTIDENSANAVVTSLEQKVNSSFLSDPTLQSVLGGNT